MLADVVRDFALLYIPTMRQFLITGVNWSGLGTPQAVTKQWANLVSLYVGWPLFLLLLRVTASWTVTEIPRNLCPFPLSFSAQSVSHTRSHRSSSGTSSSAVLCNILCQSPHNVFLPTWSFCLLTLEKPKGLVSLLKRYQRTVCSLHTQISQCPPQGPPTSDSSLSLDSNCSLEHFSF